MDLVAAVDSAVTLDPGAWRLVSTGIRIAVPDGMEAQVRPRSGLAFRNGIGVLNAPGTVDSDYRGVVSVILFNFGKEPFQIRRGDRIAQMVIQRTLRAEWIESSELDGTERNSGGFGSTGK
jgi:dUTP pyrophosphatase